MFIPELNKVCDVSSRPGPIEPVLLGDGSKRPLLRVDQTTAVDGKPAAGVRRPGLRRCRGAGPQVGAGCPGRDRGLPDDQGGARWHPAGPVKFDLILYTVVKVPQEDPQPRADATRQVSGHAQGFRPGQVFPSDSRQSVAAQQAGTARPPGGQERPAPWTASPSPRRSPRIPQAQRAGDAATTPGSGAWRSGSRGASSTPGRRPRRSTIGSPENMGKEFQGRLRRGGRGRPQPDRRLHRARRARRGDVPRRRASPRGSSSA